MLNATVARNFAETVFGRPDRAWSFGTTRFNTNRAGAYWFECSEGKGFILDARALSQKEKDLFALYTPSHTATKFTRPGGQVGYLNPFASFTRQQTTLDKWEGAERRDFEVYALPATPDINLGSRCYRACLPVVLAGIAVRGRFEHEEAFEIFKQDFKPTDATLRALGADKWLTPKPEPTPGFF